MAGIKISDADRKNMDSKFICSHCHYLLVNPLQTSCGHLFCKSCIDILLGGPDPKCPEDQEKLSKNEVFLDAFTKREIKKIQLHCLFEQCKWFGAYEELEGHYQVCEHALISCIHKRCNIQLPRSLLDEHLKNECEYRNVKCECCGKDVPYASLKDHKENVCENALVTCKYCNQMIPRKDIEHHESTICDEVPTDFEFQAIGCSHDKTLKRREIRQHTKDSLIDHVFALLRYVKAFVTQLSNYVARPEFTTAVQNLGDRITAVRSNLSEKFVMLVGKLTGLERKIESLERRIESLENRGEQNRIASLESQVTIIFATIQWMWERLDERGDLPDELHDARAL